MENSYSGFSSGGLTGPGLKSTIKRINDSMVAANPQYLTIDLGIGQEEGTDTIVSDSMATLKNNPREAVGIDNNVTYHIYTTMNNPDMVYEDGNQIRFFRGGVGLMTPYDKYGNDLTGSYTMEMIG